MSFSKIDDCYSKPIDSLSTDVYSPKAEASISETLQEKIFTLIGNSKQNNQNQSTNQKSQQQQNQLTQQQQQQDNKNNQEQQDSENQTSYQEKTSEKNSNHSNIISKSKKILKKKPHSKYVKLDHDITKCQNCIANNFKNQEKCYIYKEKLRKRKQETAAEARQKKKDEMETLLSQIQDYKDMVSQFQNQIEKLKQNQSILEEKVITQKTQLDQYTQLGQSLLNNQQIEEQNQQKLKLQQQFLMSRYHNPSSTPLLNCNSSLIFLQQQQLQQKF